MRNDVRISKMAPPALFAAVVGPIQNVAGWLIAGSLWASYDPFTKTISDLAADDSPVKWVQTGFFLSAPLSPF